MNKALYRHEQKYYIRYFQYEELKYRLEQLMCKDENALEQDYTIRSLYFDDLYQMAYKEKQDGVNVRRKYRIRTYNYNTSQIKLECKHKWDRYIYKESISLTLEEYKKLMLGDALFLLNKGLPMAQEFYVDLKTKILRPRVIVDYEREAYIEPVGTVRVTFDKNVRAVGVNSDLFEENAVSYEVFPWDTLILEIKFTGILPEKIRRIFRVRDYTQVAASKYCLAADQIHLIKF